MIGKDIYLRAVEPNDIDVLYDMENEMAIWHLSDTHVPFSRFDMEQYVFQADKDIYVQRQLRLMVIEKDTNNVCGAIDLFDFDPANQRAGVGIIILESHRGKGFGRESLVLIKKYAFETLNLKQVYCNIHAINETSLQLFRKQDFKDVGILKSWTLINNTWHDVHILQCLNPSEKE